VEFAGFDLNAQNWPLRRDAGVFATEFAPMTSVTAALASHGRVACSIHAAPQKILIKTMC
jgi:hypothetical protein